MVLGQIHHNLSHKAEMASNIQETTGEDFSYPAPDSSDSKSKAGTENTMKNGCCGHIKIRSSGLVRAMYPHILGDYKHVDSITYIKPSTRPVYLSQPEPTGLVWGYTWGVSQARGARWGYIRSGHTSPCPTRAGTWKVYDRLTKTWVMDTTLQVLCSGK